MINRKKHLNQGSRLVKNGAKAALVTLGLAALIVFVGLRLFELRVTFHPSTVSASAVWSSPARAEDVWFSTADGVRLNGWYLPARQASDQSVIYFHGNAGNISNVGWIGEALSEEGFNVLLVDYRGSGRSEGRLANEDQL